MDNFPIKTACHMQKEIQERTKRQSSKSKRQRRVWPIIRKLNIPNANKVFLWRESLEALPTNLNLFRKKVVENPKCPICIEEEELVDHALWGCIATRDVQSQCTNKIQKSSFTKMNFMQLMKNICETFEKGQNEEISIVARRIWLRKNDFVFISFLTHPRNHVVLHSKQILQEMKVIQVERTSSPEAISNQPQCWTPPQNSINLYWDAAINKALYKIGIGAIAKDLEGTIMATLRMNRSLFPNPLLAKTFVAL